MENTMPSNADDNATREALAQVGSARTLHEIYGLFYGGMAAPDPADPGEYLPVIFEEDPANPVSEEDAESLHENLLMLWNFLAQWKADKDPFYFPEAEYAATYQGVLQHLTDNLAMVQYFIAGLNLGGTEEDDFSEDAVGALHELEEVTARLQKNLAVCEKLDPKAVDDDPEATAEMLDEVEEIIADCIAQVTIGLKAAKRG
jgi:hypothetical protein